MTCRHAKGDPNCSSTVGGYAQQELASAREASAKQDAERKVAKAEARVAELIARTPNPDKFEIVKHAQVGPHMVLMVQYSSCPDCSFDSRKVMVHLDTDAASVMYWRSIDPHFAIDGGERPAPVVAPPPRARFPADDEGWKDALALAKLKSTTGIDQ